MLTIVRRHKGRIAPRAGGPVRSRIRRDPPPPPPPKRLTAREVRIREAWRIALGSSVFGLALFLILLGVGKSAGWSPSQYEIVLQSW